MADAHPLFELAVMPARAKALGHGGARRAMRRRCAGQPTATRLPIAQPRMRSAAWCEREHLYGAAGVEPGDIDFVQTYDDYPVIASFSSGSSASVRRRRREFIRRNSFTVDGSFPINTCGGQLSVGQAGCAAGFLGLVETIRQLTGRNLAHPVADARFGIAVGFGMTAMTVDCVRGAAISAGQDA